MWEVRVVPQIVGAEVVLLQVTVGAVSWGPGRMPQLRCIARALEAALGELNEVGKEIEGGKMWPALTKRKCSGHCGVEEHESARMWEEYVCCRGECVECMSESWVYVMEKSEEKAE